MSTKHTAGNWRIGDAGKTIFGPKTHLSFLVTIASIAPSTLTGREEKKANAHLIAAAPEMLAALLEAELVILKVRQDSIANAKNYADADRENARVVNLTEPALTAIRTAIAKAKGGAL